MANIDLKREVVHEEFHKRRRRMEDQESSKEDLPFIKDGLAFRWFINA